MKKEQELLEKACKWWAGYIYSPAPEMGVKVPDWVEKTLSAREAVGDGWSRETGESAAEKDARIAGMKAAERAAKDAEAERFASINELLADVNCAADLAAIVKRLPVGSLAAEDARLALKDRAPLVVSVATAPRGPLTVTRKGFLVVNPRFKGVKK